MVIYLYGYYIIIKGLTKLSKAERNTLNELIEDIMVKPTIKTKDNLLYAVDVVKDEDLSWEEFIVAINGDFYTDLRVYESVMYNSKIGRAHV